MSDGLLPRDVFRVTCPLKILGNKW